MNLTIRAKDDLFLPYSQTFVDKSFESIRQLVQSSFNLEAIILDVIPYGIHITPRSTQLRLENQQTGDYLSLEARAAEVLIGQHYRKRGNYVNVMKTFILRNEDRST